MLAKLDLSHVEWYLPRAGSPQGCIAVGRVPNPDGGEDLIVIGNPRTPDEPVQVYTLEEWRNFREGLKHGDFDDVL